MMEKETNRKGQVRKLRIFAEILQERMAQDKQWGGEDHDRKHTIYDWVALLAKHLGKSMGTSRTDNYGVVFRRQMVKVAALAVAAIEWIDRYK